MGKPGGVGAGAAQEVRAVLTPVRDLFGRKVWRVRVASRAEMTCLDCGETTVDGYCLRCVAEAEANPHVKEGRVGRRLTPTVSYLRENEYEVQ